MDGLGKEPKEVFRTLVNEPSKFAVGLGVGVGNSVLLQNVR
jgi:hypothetical protein